jgi:hypothetical protein
MILNFAATCLPFATTQNRGLLDVRASRVGICHMAFVPCFWRRDEDINNIKITTIIPLMQQR